MLFDPEPSFEGLPRDGFATFSLEDRDARRAAIVETFHGPLARLGDDLLLGLGGVAPRPLHRHIPRLDWPPGYSPFCTWLALSAEPHGYQAGAQLNVGVHADHVTVRLGWDTAADAFGRFEFLCLLAGLGQEVVRIGRAFDLRIRVYASAPWPRGSECVLSTEDGVPQSFEEVQRRGVWWELGRKYELPAALDRVAVPGFGAEALELFRGLMPLYARILGDGEASGPGASCEGSEPPDSPL